MFPRYVHYNAQFGGGATSFTSGARRQGALAPQLPRVTRSSEFPSEHLFSFMELRWSTGCLIFFLQVITFVTIVRLFTPKNIIFQIFFSSEIA
jgi:hypothetical protein